MTPETILGAIAPELSDVDPDVLEVHLALAEMQTGTVYKGARPHAVALLAAHTLTLATREGVSGAVSSIKEDRLSIGFASAATDDLGSTSYGAELLRVRRQYVMAARTRLV